MATDATSSPSFVCVFILTAPEAIQVEQEVEFGEDLNDIPLGLRVFQDQQQAAALQLASIQHPQTNALAPGGQAGGFSSSGASGPASAAQQADGGPTAMQLDPSHLPSGDLVVPPISSSAALSSLLPGSLAPEFDLHAAAMAGNPLPPLVSTLGAPVIVKRPRGRPRKIQGTDSRGIAIPAAAKPAAPSVPRSRGRPRGSKSKSSGGRGSAKKRGRISSDDEDLDGEGESEDEMTGQGRINLSEEMPDDYNFDSPATTKFGRKISRPTPFSTSSRPPVRRKRAPAQTNPDALLMCQVCHEGHSQKSNKLVICDSCTKGWHQICHSPTISEELVSSEVSWLCSPCDLKLSRTKAKVDVNEGTEWTNGIAAEVVKDAEGKVKDEKRDYQEEEKKDWLLSLPVHTLANYVLSIEKKFSPLLSTPSSALPIWPTNLPSILDALKAERIADDARRAAHEEAEAAAALKLEQDNESAGATPSSSVQDDHSMGRARTVASETAKRSSIVSATGSGGNGGPAIGGSPSPSLSNAPNPLYRRPSDSSSSTGATNSNHGQQQQQGNRGPQLSHQSNQGQLHQPSQNRGQNLSLLQPHLGGGQQQQGPSAQQNGQYSSSQQQQQQQQRNFQRFQQEQQQLRYNQERAQAQAQSQALAQAQQQHTHSGYYSNNNNNNGNNFLDPSLQGQSNQQQQNARSPSPRPLSLPPFMRPPFVAVPVLQQQQQQSSYLHPHQQQQQQQQPQSGASQQSHMRSPLTSAYDFTPLPPSSSSSPSLSHSLTSSISPPILQHQQQQQQQQHQQRQRKLSARNNDFFNLPGIGSGNNGSGEQEGSGPGVGGPTGFSTWGAQGQANLPRGGT